MTDHNGWAYDWEDRVIKIKGAEIKVETQLTEWTDDVLAQRHALALAHSVKANRHYMLKITYDLNPKHSPLIDDVEETARVAHNHVCFEADLIDLVHSIGHGPQLLKFTKCTQNEWMPYPGGQINFMVMTRVPGANLDTIRDRLSLRERERIRSQLAKILEAMADKDRVLRTVDPSFLRYDRANDKLYLVDLTHWAYQTVEHEITVDSPFVLEFGLWTDEDLMAARMRERETSQEPRRDLPFR